MRRHRPSARRRAAPPSSSSSSDEEDAFTALSNRRSGGGGGVSNKRKRTSSVSSEPSSGGGNNNSKNHHQQQHDTEDKSPSSSSKTSSNSTTNPAAGVDNTSSNRRHHSASTERAAKMDALMQELQADAASASSGGGGGGQSPSQSQRLGGAVGGSGYYGPGGGSGGGGTQSCATFVPQKKGSFVEAGEEHLTTNIFVGNLDPSVTEEQLTELFRQFGDLYSVKIMWPRTAEERARNRNTGFVCFMTRQDAQEAMDAHQDDDPFRNGRRMLLRWGKNVKKTVKRGTGGVPVAPIAALRKERKEKKKKDGEEGSVDGGVEKDRSATAAVTPQQMQPSTAGSEDYRAGAGANAGTSTEGELAQSLQLPQDRGENSGEVTTQSQATNTAKKRAEKEEEEEEVFDPKKDGENVVRVTMPSDSRRVQFITTVASFVAKDGSILERKLIEKESSNPDFSFLNPPEKSSAAGIHAATMTAREEFIFYRWRVYAFCQGDGKNAWRTKPFRMFTDGGMWWIPPPLDREAARREEEFVRQREMEILNRQETRRKLASKKDYMTGRQLEHAKYGNLPDGEGMKLTSHEREQLDALIRTKLSASRKSICEAMAFCFDHSEAAVQIAQILKDAAMQSGRGVVSVDTRIARLYLLSDVLFNSQQPGVKNAFRYRDAIESMAPDVFKSLGEQGKCCGRMTMNKLRRAVDAVLGAWNNWSVYNDGFIEDLHAVFEGKDKEVEAVGPTSDNTDGASAPVNEEGKRTTTTDDEKDGGRGDGDEDFPRTEQREDDLESEAATATHSPKAARGDWTVSEVAPSLAGEKDGDIDGEPLDGEPLDGESLDGEPLDGEPLDGEPFYGESLDGEPLDGEPLDGEPLDGEPIDGEPLDS